MRAGVGAVRPGVGNDDVRSVIMVDVGNGDPAWVGPGGNRQLTKVLCVRRPGYWQRGATQIGLGSAWRHCRRA